MLRLDPATGAAAAGNPLGRRPTPNARRIVAYGLRNPFRLTFRPGHQRDLDRRRRLEHLGGDQPGRQPDRRASTNFGWPCYEGNARQPGYDGANLTICENLYAAQPAQTPRRTSPTTTPAKVVAGEACPTGSSSSTGVAFYPTPAAPTRPRTTARSSSPTTRRRCIWAMLPAAPGGLPDPANLQTFAAGAASPVDLAIGPGGDLYYADLAAARSAGSATTPATSRRSPSIDATPTSGAAPLTVTFNGAGSTDPDPADQGLLTLRSGTSPTTARSTRPRRRRRYTYTTAGHVHGPADGHRHRSGASDTSDRADHVRQRRADRR